MTLTESTTKPIPRAVSRRPDERDLDGTRRQSPPRGPARRAWRWRTPSRSGWIVTAIGALAAVLYTWSLAAVGYGNSYYAAAVKSASVSWKALFFGSIDPGSFITVDKSPAAFWVQGLSARIFGFSSLSMLLPEAIAGVASVLILHRLVRKWAGDWAAHLAALAFAFTPVAVLMFRYNNPDALLTLLCLGAAWALWSAVETGRTRTLVLAAVLVGLAFNTKMLQAFLVLPAFILVYLVAGKPQLGKRLVQLTAALVALIVSSGWWVAIVALWPASARPFVGSTSNNSILSLVFGYNGLSRIFGNSSGGAGPPGVGGATFGGTPGWLRMFNSANGGQISWLLPLAGAGLVGGLWLTRHARRTDRGRAGWLLWGGWAVVSVAVFSLSQGIFHQYYSVQLAPAVAALAGAGAVTPIGAALAAAGFWLGHHLRSRAFVLTAAAVATATLLAGPAAYSLTTIGHPQSGPVATAGPGTTGGGFGGAPGATTTADAGLVSYLQAHRGTATYLVAAFGSQSSAPIIIASGDAVITIGGFNGGDPAPTLAQFEHLVATGQVRYVLVSGTGGGGGGPGGGGAGNGSSISQWVVTHGKEVPSSSYGASSGNETLYSVSTAA